MESENKWLKKKKNISIIFLILFFVFLPYSLFVLVPYIFFVIIKNMKYKNSLFKDLWISEEQQKLLKKKYEEFDNTWKTNNKTKINPINYGPIKSQDLEKGEKDNSKYIYNWWKSIWDDYESVIK